MSVDFNKFDSMIDKTQISKEIAEAAANQNEYDEVPNGTYIVTIEKMEIKPTKANDKLMFAVGCKIKETVDAPSKQDGRWVFFNRIIAGNRTSEKWNDGRAIQSVITWLSKIDDTPIEFTTYSAFADEVLEIFQDVAPSIELKINYKADDFNPIVINEVYDV